MKFSRKEILSVIEAALQQKYPGAVIQTGSDGLVIGTVERDFANGVAIELSTARAAYDREIRRLRARQKK